MSPVVSDDESDLGNDIDERVSKENLNRLNSNLKSSPSILLANATSARSANLSP